MNRIIIVLLAVSLMTFTACRTNKSTSDRSQLAKTDTETTQTETLPMAKPFPGTPILRSGADTTGGLTPPTEADLGSPDEVAVLETAKGEIVVEFFPDVAPLHVANFKKLSRIGFYSGTYFHRVLPGFVVQGGDPNTKDGDPRNDGMGGPPWELQAEFNKIPHDLGILSMARSQDPNSGGSQFFICLTRERTRALDNQYTVFGRVIRGIEVVEEIGATRRDPSNPDDRTRPGVSLLNVRIVKRSEIGL